MRCLLDAVALRRRDVRATRADAHFAKLLPVIVHPHHDKLWEGLATVLRETCGTCRNGHGLLLCHLAILDVLPVPSADVSCVHHGVDEHESVGVGIGFMREVRDVTVVVIGHGPPALGPVGLRLDGRVSAMVRLVDADVAEQLLEIQPFDERARREGNLFTNANLHALVACLVVLRDDVLAVALEDTDADRVAISLVRLELDPEVPARFDLAEALTNQLLRNLLGFVEVHALGHVYPLLGGRHCSQPCVTPSPWQFGQKPSCPRLLSSKSSTKTFFSHGSGPASTRSQSTGPDGVMRNATSTSCLTTLVSTFFACASSVTGLPSRSRMLSPSYATSSVRRYHLFFMLPSSLP